MWRHKNDLKKKKEKMNGFQIKFLFFKKITRVEIINLVYFLFISHALFSDGFFSTNKSNFERLRTFIGK